MTLCLIVDRFHAKEYPAYDKEVFPYNMGYCQIGKIYRITPSSILFYSLHLTLSDALYKYTDLVYMFKPLIFSFIGNI